MKEGTSAVYSSTPKGWIRGNTQICLVLEVTTSYHGVDIRIESLSKAGSHTWVTISNGHDNFVRDLTENVRIHVDEDTLAGREQPVTLTQKRLVAKARARPVSVLSSSSTSTTISIHSRQWIDVEPGKQHDTSFPIAKRMNSLLRHEPLPSHVVSRSCRLHF